MVRLGTLSASWLASKGHRHNIRDKVATLTKGFSMFSSKSQHRVLQVIRIMARIDSYTPFIFLGFSE